MRPICALISPSRAGNERTGMTTNLLGVHEPFWPKEKLLQKVITAEEEKKIISIDIVRHSLEKNDATTLFTREKVFKSRQK